MHIAKYDSACQSFRTPAGNGQTAANGLVAAHPHRPYVGVTRRKISMAAKIRFANRHFHLPQSKPIRIGLGILLVAFGLVGFLPVVGFWMIPLGLLVLSVDVPIVRRWRRQLAVWWHRDRKNGEGAANGNGAPAKDPAGTKVE